METVRNGIAKHAAFYRAYLSDDRSLPQVAVLLATIVALWLLNYLLSGVGPLPKVETAQSLPHPEADARGVPRQIGFRNETAVRRTEVPSHAR